MREPKELCQTQHREVHDKLFNVIIKDFEQIERPPFDQHKGTFSSN